MKLVQHLGLVILICMLCYDRVILTEDEGETIEYEDGDSEEYEYEYEEDESGEGETEGAEVKAAEQTEGDEKEVEVAEQTEGSEPEVETTKEEPHETEEVEYETEGEGSAEESEETADESEPKEKTQVEADGEEEHSDDYIEDTTQETCKEGGDCGNKYTEQNVINTKKDKQEDNTEETGEDKAEEEDEVPNDNKEDTEETDDTEEEEATDIEGDATDASESNSTEDKTTADAEDSGESENIEAPTQKEETEDSNSESAETEGGTDPQEADKSTVTEKETENEPDEVDDESLVGAKEVTTKPKIELSNKENGKNDDANEEEMKNEKGDEVQQDDSLDEVLQKKAGEKPKKVKKVIVNKTKLKRKVQSITKKVPTTSNEKKVISDTSDEVTGTIANDSNDYTEDKKQHVPDTKDKTTLPSSHTKEKNDNTEDQKSTPPVQSVLKCDKNNFSECDQEKSVLYETIKADHVDKVPNIDNNILKEMPDTAMKERYEKEFKQIQELLKEKKNMYEEKMKELEMQLLKLENQVLMETLSKSNNTATFSKLENHVLKLENELLKLNHNLNQIQNENDNLIRKQQTQAKDLALVKEETTQSKYPMLPDLTTEISSAVSKQKDKIVELMSSIKNQSSMLQVLNTKSESLEAENALLQQKLINQSLAMSQIMAKIEGMAQQQQKQAEEIQNMKTATEDLKGTSDEIIKKTANFVDKASLEKLESNVKDNQLEMAKKAAKEILKMNTNLPDMNTMVSDKELEKEKQHSTKEAATPNVAKVIKPNSKTESNRGKSNTKSSKGKEENPKTNIVKKETQAKKTVSSKHKTVTKSTDNVKKTTKGTKSVPKVKTVPKTKETPKPKSSKVPETKKEPVKPKTSKGSAKQTNKSTTTKSEPVPKKKHALPSKVKKPPPSPPHKANPASKASSGTVHKDDPPVPKYLDDSYSLNKDCFDHFLRGRKRDTAIKIRPKGTSKEIEVWCDMKNGGWTIIQRRQDGRTDFFRDWKEYRKGFGGIMGEHWLGLDNIHFLTNQNYYTLRIDMMDWDRKEAHAEYDVFLVEDESQGYRLHISGYKGTAGDGFAKHSGMKFSTKDVDNDLAETDFNGSCAQRFTGANWYHKCYKSNLNGKYYKDGIVADNAFDGVCWKPWKGPKYSLKKVEMKIRPTDAAEKLLFGA